MDKRERKRRIFVFLTFLLNCVTIGLLSIALGTDYWITSRLRDINSEFSPPLIGSNDTITSAKQTLLRNRPGGQINFGLFHGFVRHNKGLGDREAELTTFCDSVCFHILADEFARNVTDDLLVGQLFYTDICNSATSEDPPIILENVHFFNYGLWVATIFFVALSITVAVISAIYGLLNTTYTPIAVFNGIAGLYLWNTIGIVFNLLSVLMWVVLFYTTFQYNVLPAELLYPIPKFTTCGIAELGYSFWLCLTAMLMFATNIILLTLRDVEIQTAISKEVPVVTSENLFMY